MSIGAPWADPITVPTSSSGRREMSAPPAPRCSCGLRRRTRAYRRGFHGTGRAPHRAAIRLVSHDEVNDCFQRCIQVRSSVPRVPIITRREGQNSARKTSVFTSDVLPACSHPAIPGPKRGPGVADLSTEGSRSGRDSFARLFLPAELIGKGIVAIDSPAAAIELDTEHIVAVRLRVPEALIMEDTAEVSAVIGGVGRVRDESVQVFDAVQAGGDKLIFVPQERSDRRLSAPGSCTGVPKAGVILGIR